MRGFAQDLRFAIRSLVRHPGFSLVALLSLSLGIGANATIFSAVESVLLDPLPFPSPGQLVRVSEFYLPKGESFDVSAANAASWRQSGVFSALALVAPGRVRTQSGPPVEAWRVSSDFFSLLGRPMARGRGFEEDEDNVGAAPSVVISQSFWESRLGGDQRALDRNLAFDGQAHRIVGIADSSLRALDPSVQVWLPLSMPSGESRNERIYRALGRLSEGISPQAARSALEGTASRLADEYPESNAQWGVRLTPLREDLVGGVSDGLLMLLAAVGLVLLIACVNVAQILMAEAERREREAAIRSVLGARRIRLITLILSESLLLSTICGAFGVLLSLWGVDLIRTQFAGRLPAAEAIEVDFRVLAFTVALSFVTAAAFGLGPAIRASRPYLSSVLRPRSKGRGGAIDRRLRWILVVSELALALVLLIGAALLVRSFWNLRDKDFRFDTGGLAALRVNWSVSPAGNGKTSEAVRAVEQLLSAVEGVNGVRAAAVSSGLPGSRERTAKVVSAEAEADVRETADCLGIGQGFFETLGIPLLQGRDLKRVEVESASRVAVINKMLAVRLFGGDGREAVDRTIRVRDREGAWRVVGVVSDLEEAPSAAPTLFLPYGQIPSSSFFVLLRGPEDVDSIYPAVRTAARRVDPALAVDRFGAIEEHLAEDARQERFYALLLSAFAAMSVVLAAVGVLGTLSFNVAQRTGEIGVRMALGADRRRILKLVLGEGMGLSLAGILVGLISTFFLTRFLTSFLYQVRVTEPIVYALYSALLIVIALVACLAPAWKAASLDPNSALRE